MRYAKITAPDINNGLGFRVSLFVQGCTIKCKGCFNPETHNFRGGKKFTSEEMRKLLDLCNHDYIQGLSILGGEPLHPLNVAGVINICRIFKQFFPDKDIWLWSGYNFDWINRRYALYKDILDLCDVMVIGPFQIEKKDLSIAFRGSSNQEIWQKDSCGLWCQWK